MLSWQTLAVNKRLNKNYVCQFNINFIIKSVSLYTETPTLHPKINANLRGLLCQELLNCLHFCFEAAQWLQGCKQDSLFFATTVFALNWFFWTISLLASKLFFGSLAESLEHLLGCSSSVQLCFLDQRYSINPHLSQEFW